MKRIILASGSPRRKELMSLTRLPFEVIVTDADETVSDDLTPAQTVEILSRRKAEAIKEEGIIIGSDTVVAIGSEILGKPEDTKDAKRILKLLSGNTHQVYTGVTLSMNGESITFSEKTDVEFYELSQEEIEEYISSSEPYDKAGAYGIQGKAGLLVKGINGDYYNVVGLPVARLKREILEFIQDV